MGDILKAIHEEYNDYVELCRKIGIKPVILGTPGESFYEHERELMRKYGYKKTGGGFIKIKD